MDTRPLTDTEFARLHQSLCSFSDNGAMNLETLDGFLAALICCPGNVLPSEYLPNVLGAFMEGKPAFSTAREWRAFMGLLIRYRDGMASTLESGEIYVPLLHADEYDRVSGNDWAVGFLRGITLRQDEWAELLADEGGRCALIPILALAHEHDPDPDLRPSGKPIGTAQREHLLAGAAAGVAWIHRYFRAERRGSGCSCLQCCGNETLH